jgi:hypothetical protein
MSKKNIWQPGNFDDLIYFLRNGANKFIVLTEVLVNDNDNIKHMLRKFIKQKSLLYPNVMFLYYAVRNEDLKKKLNIIEKDVSKYPKMFHIYNGKEVFMEISCIDSEDILHKLWGDAEKQFLYESNNIKNSDVESKKSSIVVNNTSNEDNFFDEDQNEHGENNNVPNINIVIDNNQQTQQFINPVTESKKNMEKILLLRYHADDFNKTFIKDCLQRKKEESKMSKHKNKEK